RARDLTDQVHAVPLEDAVGLDVDEDVEVARGAALGAGFALAAQHQPLAVVDASGDLHLHRGALLLHTLPVALHAGVANHAPAPAAAVARRHRLERAEEGVLGGAHLAAAAAGGTRLRRAG